MAVRHGYGKVAGTDALVFAYDTGDTRNSYRGEPTTNLITDTSDFGNTFWNQKNGTFTANDAIGPRGIQNAAKIVAVNTDPYIYSNVVVTVSAGSVTWSIWVKGIGNTIGKSAEVRINFTGTASGTDNNVSITLTDQWQLLQVSATATGGGTIKFGLEAPNGAVSGDIMYFADPMFEQKSHATQFVNGTRSATQGLLDLTGNSSIDLSNVSFDSNAQMTFDGTNDYVDLSSATSLLNLGSTFSIEGVFKLDNTSQEFGTVFSSLDVATGTQTKGVGFYWKKTAEYGMSANTIRLQLGLSAWSWHIFASNGISISDTNYHHVAVTLTGGSTDYPTIVFYIDGVAQAATKWTAGSIGPINNSSNANSLRLGSIYTASNSSYNNFYSAESLNVVKIYNRVLTAAEVRNNYNNYKSRFNI